eukprot:TRINITY_DN2659_c0_g1_i3.p1 TRINITY_DN2659_c0_g1~~TRINITY_DN2659_c0_g1_i3.p1  ORF type:complete len:537 (-),score=156.96 TRINITY_DN2659_c0_g1_i3:39-1649(-)
MGCLFEFLQSENDRLVVENHSLRAELIAAHDKISQLQGITPATEAKNESLENKNLKKQVESLQQENALLLRKISDFKRDLEILKTSIHLLAGPKALQINSPVARSPTEAVGGKAHLIYLDLPFGLGGRGGVVRSFFLLHGIEYTEKLLPFGSQEWENEKKELISSGLNPAGLVPVVKIGNLVLTEHIAILRYLAGKLGLYGKDDWKDYCADAVADEYQGYRNAWVASIGANDAGKAAYKEKQHYFLELLEALYARKASPTSPYLGGGNVPGFVDLAMWGQLRDDSIVNGDVFVGGKYPTLKGMFDAVGAVHAIKSWLATSSIGGKPHLIYLALPFGLGGRGGVVRSFFLLHGIPYTEKLVPFGSQEWENEKKELISSGLNPAGLVPVVKVGGLVLTEHIAIVRYFSGKLGFYGKDDWADYCADAVADEYQGYRNAWVTSIGANDAGKAAYKEKQQYFLELLESLYTRKASANSPYLGGGNVPGFVDLAMWGQLRDDSIVNGDVFAGGKHPTLKALFNAVGALPAIKEWASQSTRHQ